MQKCRRQTSANNAEHCARYVQYRGELLLLMMIIIIMMLMLVVIMMLMQLVCDL